jgi:hypothetical protein
MNKLTLVIEWIPGTNQPPRVVGPLGEKMLCYAMLEGAKEVIRSFVPPQIIPVGVIPNGFEPTQRK